MREIVSDVYLVEGLLGVNVYLLASSEGVTLVDSGPTGRADHIVAEMTEAGYALSDLRSIVLTHWHGDHTGGAAELARRSGAQVVAHRLEAPIIEQTEPAPASSWIQGLLRWLSDHVVLRREACQVDRRVEDGDEMAALGGIQVVHTPGHSPGSLCLYQPERQILFTGDALFAAHPITGKRKLGLYMRLFALDTAQARESAKKLAALPVDVLCCGHGEPIVGGAGEQIRALFREVA